MKDLTCEKPQYFNIRHTERGILTKNTKKTGNLHCIMAFKKIQESVIFQESFFEMTGHTDSEGAKVTLSEVEELDSSDSDYPQEEYLTASHKPQLKKETLHITDLEIESRHSTSNEEDKVKHSDAIDYEPVVSGMKRSGTFTKDISSVSTESTRTGSESNEYYSPSLFSSNTDYPEIHLHTTSDDDQVVSLGNEPTSALKRSGTFTKETPSIHIERTRSSSSDSPGESSVDMVDYSGTAGGLGNEPTSGLKRSGTFTKETPSIHIERTRSSSSDSPGESSVDMVDYSGTAGGLGNEPTSGLKRSGTFTKETPSIHIERTRSSSSDSPGESSVDMVDYSGTSGGLKRSGTFTKEPKTDFSIHSEDSSDEETTNSLRITEQGSATSKNSVKDKRRDTYTKDNGDLDAPLPAEDIDLDETLKASDDGSSSSEDL